MPVVEETVLVPRTPEEVFAYLTDAANFPIWDSSIVEAEKLTEGPVAVGTRFRGASKVMGRRFDWTTEITECQPGRRTVSKSVEGSMNFTVVNELEPVGESTRFTYRIEAESGLGGNFGRFMDSIVEKAQAKTIRQNLATLTTLLGISA
jgi:carbon monoxide dehydrogenase subunit G